MSIYAKARAKIAVSTVLISLGIIVGFWLLLFVTDYIMFKNNMPILFATTDVQDIKDKHIIVEKGLGYYVITNEENVPELYLFGHKIK